MCRSMRRSQVFRFIFLSLLLLMLSPGCTGTGGNGAPPTDVPPAATTPNDPGETVDPVPAGAAGQACRSDGTCDTGLECLEGVCVTSDSSLGSEGNGCRSDGTCDAGLECLEGVCVTAEPEPEPGTAGNGCRSDGTCDEGLECKEEICVTRESDPKGGLGESCHPDGTCDEGLSCSEGQCAQPPEPDPEPVLGVSSFPPVAASADEPLRYRVLLSKVGDATYTLSDAPLGATVDGNGNISWLPGEEQGAGEYNFEVTAALGEEFVSQAFKIYVPGVELEVTGQVDPESVSVITVDAPLSSLRGTGIIVPEGAMTSGDSITISSVTQEVPLAASTALNQEGQETEVTVVDFGPSGTVFAEPVSLVIPSLWVV